MEASVDRLFKDEIFSLGKKLFNVDGDCKKLGDFESYIFSGSREGKECILRFTHSSHRSTTDVLAEVEWVYFLKENGAQVPEHYYSTYGKLAEAIPAEDSSYFIVACYQKFNGTPLKFQEVEDEGKWELVEEWGKTIGQLHRITKEYTPTDGIKRPSWKEEELLNLEETIQNPSEKLLEYRNRIVDHLDQLPVNTDLFGLIHSDIHAGNFLVDNGKINVFDFDDSSYHWFASDIAIALYYTMLSRDFRRNDKREEVAQQFLEHFMKGYETENQLPDHALQSIPYFLQLRDIVLHSVLNKKLDPATLNENDKRFIQMVNDRIEAQQPIVDVKV